jgi:hypothetical protein
LGGRGDVPETDMVGCGHTRDVAVEFVPHSKGSHIIVPFGLIVRWPE